MKDKVLRMLAILEEINSGPIRSENFPKSHNNREQTGKHASIWHVHWMLEQVKEMIDTDPEKAIRWISFCEGALWALEEWWPRKEDSTIFCLENPL